MDLSPSLPALALESAHAAVVSGIFHLVSLQGQSIQQEIYFFKNKQN